MLSSNFALCDVILPYVHFCCWDQMQHRENGLIWLPIPGFTPILQWKLRQELEVGSQIHSPEWRETEWWVFKFSNLSALTRFRTPFLGSCATHSGQAFQSISKMSNQRHAHSPGQSRKSFYEILLCWFKVVSSWQLKLTITYNFFFLSHHLVFQIIMDQLNKYKRVLIDFQKWELKRKIKSYMQKCSSLCFLAERPYSLGP